MIRGSCVLRQKCKYTNLACLPSFGRDFILCTWHEMKLISWRVLVWHIWNKWMAFLRRSLTFELSNFHQKMPLKTIESFIGFHNTKGKQTFSPCFSICYVRVQSMSKSDCCADRSILALQSAYQKYLTSDI